MVEKTIRRKLDQLEQHGAQRSDDGQWVIPWAALRAIGLHPGKPTGPDKSTGQTGVSSGLDQGENLDLRHRLDISEIRLAAAEQLAAEKDLRIEEKDKRIADLAMVVDVLRHQLTTGSVAPAVESSESVDVHQDRGAPVGDEQPTQPVAVPDQSPPAEHELEYTSGLTSVPASRWRKFLKRRR